MQSRPYQDSLDLGHKPVEMVVSVRENKPFQFRYGGFYDTERGLGAIGDFTNRNSLGNARVVGLRLRYDSEVQEVRTYLSQPFLKRLPVSGALAGFTRRETHGGIVTDRFGLSAQQQTWWSDKKYILSLGLRFEKAIASSTRAAAFDNSRAFGGVRLTPITTSLTRETRDGILDATRGSFWSSAFEYAPARLGSDIRYWSYFGQYSKYVPLSKSSPISFPDTEIKPRLVYASSIRVGLGKGLGGERLPVVQRFFAGGGTTIRGFEEDTVGPKDADGNRLGGDSVFVLNNELRFPLFRWLGGVAFVDVGNVWARVEDFNPLKVRKTAGLGLRLKTPFVLMRADYGYKLDRRPGESPGAFFFSIGQTF